MKLIFENWRRYLNESVQISQGSERLLSLLVNLNKFGSVEEFLSRCKLVIHEEGLTLGFVLLIDERMAGMVNYIILNDYENCRPNPYQDKRTYMLGNVAREGSFKGFGIGKLISFLSACHVNSIGGVITSDRDTSDKAGKELVDSLKMIGARQSEEFDYVGYFISQIEKRFFDSDGNYSNMAADHMAPMSNKTGIVGKLTGGIHDDRLKAEFDQTFPELLKKVLNHLKPLTSQKEDDCEPSRNIIISNGRELNLMFYSKEFPQFLEKVLTMSSQEVQDFFNSDERVQGYTFVLPDMMIKAGKEIINAIDATESLSDEERLNLSDSAIDMFSDVYDSEIGRHGEAKD